MQQGKQLWNKAHSAVEMHQGFGIFGIHPLLKNITDNKIWKSIPGGGGKLSGGEGKRRGCLRRGLVFGAERVLGVESALVSSLSHVNTFARSSSGLRRAAAAHHAIGGMGFALRTGAGVTPPCQNRSNFTTHGTCEHDTVARRRIILSRPSETNVLAPHYSILLSHSLCSWLVWISPPPSLPPTHGITFCHS